MDVSEEKRRDFYVLLCYSEQGNLDLNDIPLINEDLP